MLYFSAAMQTYHVKVQTGTKWGAGTDANVYVMLYGEQDSTGKLSRWDIFNLIYQLPLILTELLHMA